MERTKNAHWSNESKVFCIIVVTGSTPNISEELNQCTELDDVISCLEEKAENEDDVFHTNVCVKDVESLFVN